MDKRRRLAALLMTSMLVLSSCSAPAGNDYEKARELFAQGQYQQARELFVQHPDYRNTEQYIDYIDAWQMVEQGNYDGASQAFSALGSFLDSAEEAKAFSRVAGDRTWYDALNAFISGDYDNARHLFEQSGGDGAQSYLAYMDALDLEKNGDTENALRAFRALNGFRDSREIAERLESQLKDLDYQKAEQLAASGELEAALAAFEKLGSYRDTRRYVLYLNARSAETEGRLEDAMQQYADLGRFLDAQVHFESCLEQYRKSLYNEAETLVEAGQLATATDLLSGLDGYADSSEFLIYVQARTFMAEGRFRQAASAFESLGTYRDSAERALAAKEALVEEDYQKGVAFFEEGKMASGAFYLKRTSDYLDSLQYLLYMEALDCEKEGRYQEALDRLWSVPGFLDADTKAAEDEFLLEKLTLGTATDLVGEGNYGEARSLLREVRNLPEAAPYREWLRAEEMARLGEYGDAARILDSLGTFRDAGSWARGLETMQSEEDYAMGVKAFETGDIGRAKDFFSRSGLKDSSLYLAYLEATQDLELATGTDLLSVDTQTLKDSETMLLSLDTFLDSHERAEAMGNAWRSQVYAEALDAFAAGDTDTARIKMAECLPYGESSFYCSYLDAMLQENNGEYREASECFASLNGFLDSADRAEKNADHAREETYIRAMGLIALDRLEEAGNVLAGLGNYLNTDELLSYIRAREYESEGQTADAAELYQSLSVLDSHTRAEALRGISDIQLMENARNALRKGDLQEASDLISAMEGIDGAEKLNTYLNARLEEENGETETAIALYESLSDGVEDSQERASVLRRHLENEENRILLESLSHGEIPENTEQMAAPGLAVYRQAVIWMNEGNLDSARCALAAVRDLPGAAHLLEEADRLAAEEAVRERDWKRAERILSGMEDCGEMPAQVKAQQLMEQAQYSEALAALDGLESPESLELAGRAREKLKEQSYLLALEALGKGDMRGAAAGMEELGDYRDCNQYIRYLQARELEKKGSFAPASRIYRELGEFLDSSEHLASIAGKEKNALYSEAMILLGNGDFEDAATLFGLLGETWDAQMLADYARARSLEEYAPESALELYESLENGIRDSQSRRLNLQEAMEDETLRFALELFEEGEYEDAAQELEQLENAEDYAAYCKACLLLKDGKYQDAENAFSALEGFLDSGEKCRQAHETRINSAITEAVDLGNQGEWEKALAVLDAQNIHSEFRNYVEARVLESAGKWLGAAECYAMIPEYEDSAERCAECGRRGLEETLFRGDLGSAEGLIPVYGSRDSRYTTYLAARLLQEEGKTDKAWEEYQKLGSFLDSEKRAASCLPARNAQLYLQTLALMKEGKTEEAASRFAALGSFMDAESYAAYLSARTQLTAGNLDGLQAVFEGLGDFLDAPSCAVYVHARELETSGDMDAAEEAYASIGGFMDSFQRASSIRDSWQAMNISEAMELLDRGWDSDAREAVLGLLPQGGSGLAELLLEKARGLMEQGQYETAAGLGEILSEAGWEQAESLLEDALLGLARQQADAGEYMTALETLERSDQWDSEEGSLQAMCHRKLAEKAMEENRYAQAEAELNKCTDDETAAELLKSLDDRYQSALRCLQEGNYPEASEIFAGLYDFRESETYRKESEYRLAGQLAAQGRAAEASALYASLSGYADAQDRIDWPYELLGDRFARQGLDGDAMSAYEQANMKEEGQERIARAHYERAVEYVLENDPEMACAEFEMAGGQLDAAVRAQETRLAWGDRLREEGRYDEALEIYSECEDENVRRQREELTWMQKGEAFLKEEKWDEAAEAYAQADTYSENQTVSGIPYEILAQRLVEQGRYEEAQEAFDRAGMSDEGRERIRQRYYQTGISLYRDGLYREAEDAFLHAEGYLDARSRCEQAVLAQGEALAEAGDYQSALECYARAGDSRKTAEHMQAVYYALAEEALSLKQWDEASACFRQAGTYRNAESRILEPYRLAGRQMAEAGRDSEAMEFYRKAGREEEGREYIASLHYQAATAGMQNGDYENASVEYGLAGSYLDAPQRRHDALAAYGNQLAREGKTEAAIGVYQNLGEDSGMYIRSLYLNQAQEFLNEGMLEEALNAYVLAGERETGEQRIAEAHYAQAAAWLKAGEYEKASAEFAMCGDWLDASQRVQANMLRRGDELLAEGFYEEAVQAYENAYPDTERSLRLSKAWYAYAASLMEQNKPEQASQAYLASGSYLDAPEKSDECLTVRIRELAQAGRMDQAMKLAGKLMGEDARTGAEKEILSIQAEACLSEQNYDGAAEAYEKAGDRQSVSRVRYLQGQALEENGELEAAAHAYQQAGAYRDAAGRRASCLYSVAGRLVKKAEYEHAYDLYLEIRDFQDVASILKKTGGLREVANYREGQRKQFQIGRYVRLGKWEQDNVGSTANEDLQWMVLSITGDRVLLLSRYALDTMPADQANAWMNGTFLEMAFDERVQRSLSGEDGGLVFSLSRDQAQTYLLSSSWMQKAKAVVTRYARSHGGESTYRDGFGSYYLSDTGENGVWAIDSSGNAVLMDEDQKGICVRPAIILDLSVYLPR